MARKPSTIMAAGKPVASLKDQIKEAQLELKGLQAEAKATAKLIMAKHKEIAKLKAKAETKGVGDGKRV